MIGQNSLDLKCSILLNMEFQVTTLMKKNRSNNQRPDFRLAETKVSFNISFNLTVLQVNPLSRIRISKLLFRLLKSLLRKSLKTIWMKTWRKKFLSQNLFKILLIVLKKEKLRSRESKRIFRKEWIGSKWWSSNLMKNWANTEQRLKNEDKNSLKKANMLLVLLDLCSRLIRTVFKSKSINLASSSMTLLLQANLKSNSKIYTEKFISYI